MEAYEVLGRGTTGCRKTGILFRSRPESAGEAVSRLFRKAWRWSSTARLATCSSTRIPPDGGPGLLESSSCGAALRVRLTLGIHERARPAAFIACAPRLAEINVGIAYDDFGPVGAPPGLAKRPHYLKFDRRFICGIERRRLHAAGMAPWWRRPQAARETVAEGCETPAEVECARWVHHAQAPLRGRKRSTARPSPRPAGRCGARSLARGPMIRSRTRPPSRTPEPWHTPSLLETKSPLGRRGQ